MGVPTILENALDAHDERITARSIADATGIDKGLLSRFFNHKAELTFCDTLRVTRLIAPTEESRVVRALLCSYDGNLRRNTKPVLYYLANNYMYEELAEVGATIPANQRENRAFYDLIELLAHHKRGTMTGPTLLNAAAKVTFDSPDCLALQQIMYTFAYYGEGEHKLVFDTAKAAEHYAADIKNEFVRDCVMNTVAELLSNAYLFHRYDLRKCRFYAQVLRNNCLTNELTRVNIDYTTGMSYLFEDFDLALEHLERCAAGLTRLGHVDRAAIIHNHDIPFLHSYWKRIPAQGSAPLAGSALAYRLYVDGQHEEAAAIASDLSDSPFSLFVRGLCAGDDALLTASVMAYRLKGNALFAQLPAQHIKAAELRAIIA